MKTQTTLIWANGVIKLYPVATINTYLPALIDPGHLEHDLPIGFD